MSNDQAEAAWRERCSRHSGESVCVGRSVEGRPITGYRFRIGGGSLSAEANALAGAVASASPAAASTPPDVPTVFLLSLIHPMEWVGRELHLATLDRLLESGRPMEILSLPNANPDGTARVESALRAGVPAWVRGNAAGVDLNRNFPVSFRTRPAWVDGWPMWRPGPSPASEPETQAVLKFLEGQPLQLSLSFHSFGRWIFFPPGASRQVSQITESHASLASSVLASQNPLRYRSAHLGRWARWFRAYGIEVDTLAEQNGGWTYLVELGRSSFGRWGVRNMLQPFYVFNPPNFDEEKSGILPILERLALEAIATPLPGAPSGPRGRDQR